MRLSEVRIPPEFRLMNCSAMATVMASIYSGSRSSYHCVPSRVGALRSASAI